MSNKISNLPNAQLPKASPGEMGLMVKLFENLRQMPPVSKSDVEQIQERVGQYFRFCEEQDLKPSVEGLALALGVTRQTLWNWEQDLNSQAGQIVSRAKLLINALLTNFTLNGKISFSYTIWLQKNHFGYSDTKTVELVPKSDSSNISLEQQVDDAGLVWDDELGEFVPGKGY